MTRATFIGAFIMGSILVFEILLKDWFRKRRFIYLVLVRSLCYTFIIVLWLAVFNGIWYSINGGAPLREEMVKYFSGDDIFWINLSSVFFVAILVAGFREINSLHGKGQLLNFMLGRYHMPREIELIFCFIDLKGSTTIAEKLGEERYFNFIKDVFNLYLY